MLAKIKEDFASKQKKLKDLEVKIDNNKVLLKSEILKETNQIIEDNNNKLLIKIDLTNVNLDKYIFC